MHSFFPYFGAKHQIARWYPAPIHNRIIEPFAGSAGYATHHSHKDVVLVEKFETVANVWRYLIKASPDDILALPLIQEHQTVAEFDLSPDEAAFIGYWLDFGRVKPNTKRSSWATINRSAWGPTVRARIANQVPRIKHWTVLHGDYTDAPDLVATWFIDPPYAIQGRAYVHGAEGIDYGHLGQWCRTRGGQVMVCENVGADWLPFEPYIASLSNARATSKRSAEAIWLNHKRGFF